MSLPLSVYEELYDAGFIALPVKFNDKREPIDFPKHGIESYSIAEVQKFIYANDGANGVAIKMTPPVGMLDFDLKNTDNKDVYNLWMQSVCIMAPDFIGKTCIEKTKSGGFHIYFKHRSLKQKIGLAQTTEGREVIALYTGGLLSFCAPSPGYEIIHNSFTDIDFITDEELKIIQDVSESFNLNKQKYADKVLINYPAEYLSLCNQFDTKCTDHVFEQLLNDISLYEVKDKAYKKGQHHVPYLRKGSNSAYSAKAYFKSKRLLIMSASMSQYPNFHDRKDTDDHSWVLTPAKIVYYKNGRDWHNTITEIKMICESAGIEITPEYVTHGQFPFEVFPGEIADSFLNLSKEYSVPADYFGTTALFTIAALSGSMYRTEINIQNIVYAMLVGPSGVGKSPAYNILCGDIIEPLEQKLFDDWKRAYKEWDDAKQAARHAKPPEAFAEPKPVRKVRTAKGGTMEGIMAHAMTSPAGFGIYYDEGGKMLGSPNQFKKDNSSIDFWNEIWNGKYFNELRADSDLERFASKTRISVMIGMQTERVKNYFTRDATDSGLTYRFLFTQSDYIPLNEQVDHFGAKREPCQGWQELVRNMFKRGAYNFFKDDAPYNIPFEGNSRDLFNTHACAMVSASNTLRDKKKAGDVDEMLLTYQGKLYQYFGRFVMILAIMDNIQTPVIKESHVDGAMKLYRYYHDQAHLLFARLNADNNTDLSENERQLYDALPDNFTREVIDKVCKELKMSDKFFDTAFRRKYSKGWVKRVSRGNYMKDN